MTSCCISPVLLHPADRLIFVKLPLELVFLECERHAAAVRLGRRCDAVQRRSGAAEGSIRTVAANHSAAPRPRLAYPAPPGLEVRPFYSEVIL